MKIVIQYDQPDSFLFGISKILSATNHNTILWSTSVRTIHEMKHQIQPDLLIITDSISNEHCKIVNDIPYIVYGKIDQGEKALATIPKFTSEQPGIIDTLTYKIGFPNDILSTDILVSSNFFTGNPKLLYFMDKIFHETDFTIKSTGQFVIPSPYFVGTSNEELFMSIAKASKIVIAANNIEKVSLLYNKICAFTIDEIDENIYKMITEDKLRRKTIQKQRNEIIATGRTFTNIVTKLFKLINMEPEAQLIEQTLGNKL